MTDAPQYRIGNNERDAALTVLGNHMRAGRLNPDEYSTRATQVADARTGVDLDAVFADLPGGSSGVLQVHSPTGPPPPSGSPSAPQPFVPGASTAPAVAQPGSFNWLPIAGSLSMILFFVCGFAFPNGWNWSWIFFLLPGLIASAQRGRSH